MKTVLKKLRGKNITVATLWKDENGDVCLELDFDDDTFFCLDVIAPRNLESHCYLGNKNSKKPLKEYK